MTHTYAPDRELSIGEFSTIELPGTDKVVYLSIASTPGASSSNRFRVTEDHQARQDGRVSIHFDVAVWSPQGWVDVMTLTDTDSDPLTAHSAAEQVYRFLTFHHHDPVG